MNTHSHSVATAALPQVRRSILRKMVWESLLVSAFSLVLLSGIAYGLARSLAMLRLSDEFVVEHPLAAAEIFSGISNLGLFLAALSIFLIGFSGVATFLFAKRLAAPILALADRMSRLTVGKWNFQRSVHTGDEVEVLDHVVSDLTMRLRKTYDTLEDQVKERTQALAEQFALDRAILEGIPYGVLAVDGNGIVTGANPAASHLLGLPVAQIVGKKGTDLLPLRMKVDGKEVTAFPGNEHPIMQCLTKKTPFHSASTAHLSIIRQDETVLPTMLSVTPLVRDAELLGAIAVFPDMTEERQTDYMKSEFISLASHQLRTPLNSMLWYLEMLRTEQESPLTEAQTSYVTELDNSAKRLEKILETLIRVARLDEGSIITEMQDTDLPKALGKIVEDLKTSAKDSKIATALHVPDATVMVMTDPVLLGVVLQNLYTNAVKYSPAGSTITLAMEDKGDHVVVSLADQGMGIPKKDYPRIFQKFFRADNVRMVQANGTGLGLYITKTIVERLGGHITFESQEKKGTTFFIQLPKKA
jgi:signal transduction histidine kinase